MRFDLDLQCRPRHYLLHLGKGDFAPGLIAQGVGITKCQLHG